MEGVRWGRGRLQNYSLTKNYWNSGLDPSGPLDPPGVSVPETDPPTPQDLGPDLLDKTFFRKRDLRGRTEVGDVF